MRSRLAQLRHTAFLWRERPYYRRKLFGRIKEPYWRWRFASFGEGSVLIKPRTIQGAHKIVFGKECFIAHDSWLSAEPDSWSSPEPALVLGDRVIMRTDVTVSAAERVVLEDDVSVGAGSLIIDSDHTHGDAPGVVFNPLVTAPIHIGQGTWIGDHSVILRGVTIGAGCVIGAHAVVKHDIPAGSVAVGAPARVVGKVGEQPTGDDALKVG